MSTPALGTTHAPPERVFPTLTQAQIDRLAAHGRRRPVAVGDVLVDIGDQPIPFFVVLRGAIEVLRPDHDRETLIVTHHPGQFSGEGALLTARHALSKLRVSEPGEVLELDREQLLAVIQTDAELSEILMRALILRRVEL